VKGLTRGEQIVLVTLIGLFVVGWTVRVWRQTRAAAAATEVIGR
jgi:hypothetical protein